MSPDVPIRAIWKQDHAGARSVCLGLGWRNHALLIEPVEIVGFTQRID